MPYFTGNVWMARVRLGRRPGPAAGLPPEPARPTAHWGGEPWRDRMFAETWIASRPGPRVVSLACRNVRLWGNPAVFAFDTALPGFRYEDESPVADRPV